MTAGRTAVRRAPGHPVGERAGPGQDRKESSRCDTARGTHALTEMHTDTTSAAHTAVQKTAAPSPCAFATASSAILSVRMWAILELIGALSQFLPLLNSHSSFSGPGGLPWTRRLGTSSRKLKKYVG